MEGKSFNGSAATDPALREEFSEYFPNYDIHKSQSSLYRNAVTSIYRTKDDRFFHVHGSMNPDPMLKALGLPSDMPITEMGEVFAPFQETVRKYTAEELQTLADDNRQAGTICWTKEEFKQTEHGKANADINLFELHAHPDPNQAPGWWPSVPGTEESPRRPLAGLKVVDLTRVIAGPAVSRGLAELGASVMRVTAPHLCDMGVLHPDLNHGKWNASLDLRSAADRATLRELVLEADVFVQGYRPGVLEKYGFGEKDVVEMCRARGRGIIYCAENCYGWQGPWMGRSGWQQISDANCGVSYEYGRAMGNDEPVTPVFPNSDYCTGVAGVAGILSALIRRSEEGGSYTVNIALNYYSQWLVDSCGVYPDDVWQELWQRNGSPVFRHYHHMAYTLPRMIGLIKANSADKLFKPEFFRRYDIKSIGGTIQTVAPVLRFPGGEVEPGYSIGTRKNGVDKPRWPKDLSVEIVN
ncbi:unnamed protein product [Discula destructiva]